MVLGIWWFWWALSTFGLVGTGLMLWLAPATLVQIVTYLLKFFITTRIGNVIAAAAIAFYVADVNRSLRDEHEYAARTAAFEQAQQQRDETIAQATRAEVLKEVASQTAANAATDKEVKEFHDALPPVPFANSNPFRVGADSCRLRHILGQAGCGPKGTQGVPAPAKADGGSGNRLRFRLPRIVGRGAG